MTEARTRVVVVDDDPLVRGGVVMLLHGYDDLEVVAEAADGTSALAVVHDADPDVVLLDLRMPGMDGIEVTRRLTQDPPGDRADRLAKVLVLTTFHDEELVFGALRAGASGFLVKSSAPGHLVDAVRSVARGDSWLDAAIAGQVLRALHQVPHPTAWSRTAVDALSPREQQVLAQIAHGLSNAEIAEQFVVSEATVKTHVHRILMKTGCRDRAQAVVLAYRSGLVTT